MFTHYKLLLNLQLAVWRGPRLFLSMLFTLYEYFVINRDLGPTCQNMISTCRRLIYLYEKWDCSILLTFTGKLAAYLLLLSLTFITSCSLDSHLESKLESAVLSELSELSISVLSGVSSLFVDVCFGVPISEIILFTSSLW